MLQASAPGSPAEAERIARAALAEEREAEALPTIEALACRVAGDARLWQWTGLLHRALDQRRPALAAFERAARLAPADRGIAHGRARVALEAGLDARPLYEAALRLAPYDGELLLGQAAARFAEGELDGAIDGLAAITRAEPRWAAGQAELAKLRWMRGDGATAFAGFEQALALHPREPALWHAYVQQLLAGERFGEARKVAAAATASLGEQPFARSADAIAASELGDDAAASVAFARLPADDPALAPWRVRHLLRTGRLDAATALVAGAAPGSRGALAPYAALLWRLTGDERLRWAGRLAELVTIVDLADRLPALTELAALLRALHRARHQHLDQSVRGGTQTDGALFARIDPLIEATRAAVVEAVAAHTAALPPRDPADPALAPPRGRTPRFAGSWSVRLAGGGHHANHVHPQGWVSSALYVSLPPGGPDDGQAGWLTLGAPDAGLGLSLDPLRTVEPRAGRLVLFPSVLWHGTVPFEAGERLTIAFDVAAPVERA